MTKSGLHTTLHFLCTHTHGHTVVAVERSAAWPSLSLDAIFCHKDYQQPLLPRAHTHTQRACSLTTSHTHPRSPPPKLDSFPVVDACICTQLPQSWPLPAALALPHPLDKRGREERGKGVLWGLGQGRENEGYYLLLTASTKSQVKKIKNHKIIERSRKKKWPACPVQLSTAPNVLMTPAAVWLH